MQYFNIIMFKTTFLEFYYQYCNFKNIFLLKLSIICSLSAKIMPIKLTSHIKGYKLFFDNL